MKDLGNPAKGAASTDAAHRTPRQFGKSFTVVQRREDIERVYSQVDADPVLKGVLTDMQIAKIRRGSMKALKAHDKKAGAHVAGAERDKGNGNEY